MGKIVVVDVGGSGSRLGIASKTDISSILRDEKIDSIDALASAIRKLTGGEIPDAVAVSAPGIIKGGNVVFSRNAGWLEENTAKKISSSLKMHEKNVHIVPDGEAHAMALRRSPKVRFGAINFALGTSVGFGALDMKGDVLRSLSGDSWDLGNFKLITRAENKSLWHALGGNFGLKELTRATDLDGFRHYGWRLGSFVAQMAHIFRPGTIGLSGGVVKHHWKKIGSAFYEEYDQLDEYFEVLQKPTLVVQDFEESALTGLSTLF